MIYAYICRKPNHHLAVHLGELDITTEEVGSTDSGKLECPVSYKICLEGTRVAYRETGWKIL